MEQKENKERQAPKENPRTAEEMTQSRFRDYDNYRAGEYGDDVDEHDKAAMEKDNDPAEFAAVAGGLLVGAVGVFLIFGYANAALIAQQTKTITKSITDANPSYSPAQVASATASQMQSTVILMVAAEIVVAALLMYLAYRAEKSRKAGPATSAALSGFGVGMLLAGLGTGLSYWTASAASASSTTTGTTPGTTAMPSFLF